MSLYVHALAGEDITPWREQLAELPIPPAGLPSVRDLREPERRLRVLGLLCREVRARADADYRRLLVVALEAGLANER